MIRSAAGAGVCALMISVVPACASSQHTRWGMTPDEVRKALEGYIELTDNAGRNVNYLEATYRADGISFDVRFMFANNASRLTAVVLYPRLSRRCSAVLEKLEKDYGKQAERFGVGGVRTWRWRDEQHGNEAVFFRSLESCSVSYSALNFETTR